MPADRGSKRRDCLRLFAGAGLLSTAGCSAVPTGPSSPSIAVPEAALTDESIGIEIDGLEPGTTLALRASARSQDGTDWEAHATFDVGDDGMLSVPERTPIDGSYESADPMGLFWSKRPADAKPDRPLPPEALFVPNDEGYEVTLTAETGGEVVAGATTTRRLFDPAVERRAVPEKGIVGEFFTPPGDEPAPAVLVLHGAGGEPFYGTAGLLASHGVAALALQYFGDPEPIPDTLFEVPVEYAERAAAWLRDQEAVAGPEIGVFGFSRGGSLALLLGSRSDAIGAIVGWVPSGVVWEGLYADRTPADTSAWSIDGEPLPYLETADANTGSFPAPPLPYYEPALAAANDDVLAAATIPVEKASAPIFLASATDDTVWPSTALSERVIERLDAKDYSYEYGHDAHTGAGHYIRLPYIPTAGTVESEYIVYGGSQEANARASSGAWFETLSFFQEALSE
jgi:nucleolar protein 56